MTLVGQASLNPLSGERPEDVRRRLKSIFGGSIGNLIEWYDFYVYNSFALYFAKFFSNSKDPTAQFLTVFGIYAIAFFIRPVGGILLGSYADRSGRRAALTLSCAADVRWFADNRGHPPTYAQIGVGAPILLLLARLLQDCRSAANTRHRRPTSPKWRRRSTWLL